MRSYYCGYIFLILYLNLICGCLPLPSPSIETINDKLSRVALIEKGETILICGNNAPCPARFGEPYFTMGGMPDFQDDTVGQVIKYMVVLNPAPDQFDIKTLGELQEPGPTIKFSEPVLAELSISEAKAKQEHLRYIIFINEKVETTIHVPLYLVPFGAAACGNQTTLEATIWEAPSGKSIGTITTSSKGEFVGLAYMAHLLFIPQTQSEAGLKLTKEILKKLTGLTPDEKKVPSWQYR
ncbi:MAG: hypothetical protein OS130_04780 [Thermodesulfobacteriota bacterium]|nr:MAG: hypothetical protein OS130_04780 [Thermodesulfobacteriota bacterium]